MLWVGYLTQVKFNTVFKSGIFTNSYVTWDDMVANATDKPTLTDMATSAVKFLKAKAGAEGFFIMIEVRSEQKGFETNLLR